MPARTQKPLAEVLQDLLDERNMTLRELARITKSSSGYLSRMNRGLDDKRVSGEFAGRVAVALGLPRDYFVEYREAVVLDAIRKDGRLRERLYRSLSKASQHSDG
jgi:transcriptional regulator with XRE-family HTH domain